MAIDLVAAVQAMRDAGGLPGMGWLICAPNEDATMGRDARALGLHTQVRADCPAGTAYITD